MSDDIQQIILDELRALRSDIHPRLRAVETWQSEANGKITMIGLFATMMGGVVTWVAGMFHR